MDIPYTQKTNMTGWKHNHLKMYFLLKMAIFQQVMLGGGQRPAPKAAAAAGGGGVASLGIPEKARTPAEDIEEKWGGPFFPV